MLCNWPTYIIILTMAGYIQLHDRRWLHRLKLNWFDLLYVLLYSLLYNESTLTRNRTMQFESYTARAMYTCRQPVTTVYTRPPAVTVFIISYSPNVGVP